MRILDRQILKEILSHGLLGLLLFTFILFLRDTTRLLELVVREASLGTSILTLVFLSFPGLLTFTIPMSVLVGILITCSRMASDGEITALRAAGIGVRAFLLPVGIITVLGCVIGLYCSAELSPRANRKRAEIEQQFGLRQVSAQLQPRVFEERFPNLILYLQDVVAGTTPVWKGIFLADVSNPSGPKVTLAQEGILLSELTDDQLQLHLLRGSIHETDSDPSEYSVATFSQTDIPVQLPPPAPSSVKPNAQRSTLELFHAAGTPAERLEARVEFHRRLAIPCATLFLTLLGVPLGLSSHKGGKSTGVILTLLIVIVYYSFFIGGISLARQNWLPPWAGVWGANLLFGAWGLFLLRRADRVSPLFAWVDWLGEMPAKLEPWLAARGWRQGSDRGRRARSAVRAIRFPLILDGYIARSFLFYLVIVLATFLVLTEVVTFFLDLLNDVIRNHIPASVVLDYFLHLTPQVLYVTAPVAILVAVLISFTILSQSNETTAVRASGISLFRLVLPVFFLAGLLSAGLFLFEHFYMPAANRHQDAVRNRIKGRPAQTYYRPDRKWIFGQQSRIYYYNFFEPDARVLGQVTVFELDPVSFQLTRRISAARAHWEPESARWVFTEGWVREFRQGSVDSFQPFQARGFPELNEPPSYFLKEVKQSTQMNFLELRRYIQDLQQSGFDVVPLLVQWHRKFSFPLFALIMALIGVPFALSIGRKGALTGIACSIGIGIVYWGVSSLFEALGNLNELPPVIAAWSPNLLFGLGGLYLFLRIET